MQEMYDVYDFLTRDFPKLVDRWAEEDRNVSRAREKISG